MKKYELHTEDDYFVDSVYAKSLKEACEKFKIQHSGNYYVFDGEKFIKVDFKKEIIIYEK